MHFRVVILAICVQNVLRLHGLHYAKLFFFFWLKFFSIFIVNINLQLVRLYKELLEPRYIRCL